MLNIRPRTKWPVTGAASLEGFLGAVTLIDHEVYTGDSRRCPDVDPVTHVMAELAIFDDEPTINAGDPWFWPTPLSVGDFWAEMSPPEPIHRSSVCLLQRLLLLCSLPERETDPPYEP